MADRCKYRIRRDRPPQAQLVLGAHVLFLAQALVSFRCLRYRNCFVLDRRVVSQLQQQQRSVLKSQMTRSLQEGKSCSGDTYRVPKRGAGGAHPSWLVLYSLWWWLLFFSLGVFRSFSTPRMASMFFLNGSQVLFFASLRNRIPHPCRFLYCKLVVLCTMDSPKFPCSNVIAAVAINSVKNRGIDNDGLRISSVQDRGESNGTCTDVRLTARRHSIFTKKSAKCNAIC